MLRRCWCDKKEFHPFCFQYTVNLPRYLKSLLFPLQLFVASFDLTHQTNSLVQELIKRGSLFFILGHFHPGLAFFPAFCLLAGCPVVALFLLSVRGVFLCFRRVVSFRAFSSCLSAFSLSLCAFSVPMSCIFPAKLLHF